MKPNLLAAFLLATLPSMVIASPAVPVQFPGPVSQNPVPMSAPVIRIGCRYERYWVQQCNRSCWQERVYQGGTWIYVTKCQDIGCWQNRRICD